MTTGIIISECVAAMRRLPEGVAGAVVTDPPYHFGSIVKRFGKPGSAPAQEGKDGLYRRASTGFMGQTWDGGDIAMRPEVWEAALRLLKPGGHLVAFGGTRTHHRVWSAIEDAGFEIRDTIMWVYGSGFPKSHAAGNGWGTALKPAWEPIVLARKPLIGTVAENVIAHGTGALNIDGCRVEAEGGSPAARRRETARRTGNAPGRPGEQDPTITDRISPERYMEDHPGEALGRWPANLCHDGSEEVLEAFPDAKGQLADALARRRRAKKQHVYEAMSRGNGRDGEPSADSDNEGVVGFKMKPGTRRGDEGSAARFFYCAKASKADRGEGNKHPTVKPTELMRYLCRLVTPSGGLILDPFMGSGSTGKAAGLEGFSFLGIELNPDYAEMARQRLGPDTRVWNTLPKQAVA